MTRNTKRVVTGWDEEGEPTALFVGEAPTRVDFGDAQASELWLTTDAGEDVHSRVDTAAGEWRLDPPPGGTAFRLVTYQPGAEIGLHTTSTLDYIVVVSGELTLVLPDQEVTLYPGDTLVQRGTPHGWMNRTSERCVMAAVLVDLAEEDEGR